MKFYINKILNYICVTLLMLEFKLVWYAKTKKLKQRLKTILAWIWKYSYGWRNFCFGFVDSINSFSCIIGCVWLLYGI